MMDIEKQKELFKYHVATFTDYGNIKILDFKNPKSINYRIRFSFEEDWCRLHISGGLGELIASNYSNMTYEDFSDFTNDIGYFEGKIDCHSRPIYVYDEEKAKEELTDLVNECDVVDEIYEDHDWNDTPKAAVEEFVDDVLSDFDNRNGIGSAGYDKASKYIPDFYESVSRIGRERTGILELYMLAFKLAQKQLKEGAVEE